MVDDHPFFLAGLRRALETMKDIAIVAEGGTKDEAVKIASRSDVDILLLDLGIPGGGIEALKVIQAKHKKIKVIVLTGSDEEEDLEAAITYGATGYVLKGAGISELQDAVKAAMRGEPYVSQLLGARVLFRQIKEQGGLREKQRSESALSPTEQKIADLVSEGQSNREIAAELGISIGRVKSHMTRILRKLGVRNRIEVMRQNK